MDVHKVSRILIIAGSFLFVAAIIDPMEGSFVILAGSGLAALGMGIDSSERSHAPYWTGVFAAVLVGVCALLILSAKGGFGGESGRSMWWGLTILPYPLGWIAGVYNIVSRTVEHLKRRHVTL